MQRIFIQYTKAAYHQYVFYRMILKTQHAECGCRLYIHVEQVELCREIHMEILRLSRMAFIEGCETIATYLKQQSGNLLEDIEILRKKLLITDSSSKKFSQKSHEVSLM